MDREDARPAWPANRLSGRWAWRLGNQLRRAIPSPLLPGEAASRRRPRDKKLA